MGLDALLAELDLHPEMIVLPCRHEAKAALPWFGGHFTGILKAGEGESHLSAAAPAGLRSFLHNISAIASRSMPEFIVSAEASHHGPVDIRTPSFFAEIGSTMEQWRDERAGEAVARAILALEPEELPVFLGFGGGHYVQRQTELIFNSRVAFGHMFSSYQVPDLDLEVVDLARVLSNAAYAYIDRKSLRSAERRRLEGMVAETGLPMLKAEEIRSRFPLNRQI
ncbi:D-aminoacyl-tRNA deacylase [Methanothrix sp.]|uniref:D-aminoacyl-tRNA deacylase n=1 Tax=Methanothrix sp. TaxID=90426 RepID=UPI003BAE1C24